jgi:hypothetical protein
MVPNVPLMICFCYVDCVTPRSSSTRDRSLRYGIVTHSEILKRRHDYVHSCPHLEILSSIRTLRTQVVVERDPFIVRVTERSSRVGTLLLPIREAPVQTLVRRLPIRIEVAYSFPPSVEAKAGMRSSLFTRQR